MSDCPFCHVEPARMIHESALTIAVWDNYPVSPGHALVVPRRHVVSGFLFGSERRNLAAFARLLRDHQRAACLYCGGYLRSGGDVDHFIAWSRYPADLGHNFVLAHSGCNAKKRDFLAHPRHIESWYRTNIERADELGSRCLEAGLPYDVERTRAVAWWAYEQGEQAGAHAWIRGDEVERLGRAWRDALGGVVLPHVAEPAPPSFLD